MAVSFSRHVEMLAGDITGVFARSRAARLEADGRQA
jgi:hypothetical protein